MRKMTGGAFVALLATAVVLVAVPSAGAATITGCVNKKTGSLRIRTGKAAKRKCPKGWTKIRWNNQGPAGAPGLPGANGTNGTNGAPGPNIMLRDAAGNVVGQFLGSFPVEGAIYFVLRDGGIYTYVGSGRLFPLGGGSPDFKTSGCTGQAYIQVSSSSFTTQEFVKLIGGPFRFVFRTISSGVFGPAMAWKANGSTEGISSVQLYHFDSTTGACVTDGAPTTGTLASLDSVTAPPDFTGPLTIG